MKKLHSLFTAFFLLAGTQLTAQIYLKLQWVEPDRWGVFAVTESQLPISTNTITGTAQVTLVLNVGEAVANFTSVAGTWGLDPAIVSPPEAPDKVYYSVGLLFDNGIDYVAGGETLLFKFAVTGGSAPVPQLICNEEDPFTQLPNSAGTNPGNDFSVIDIGTAGIPAYYFAGVLEGDCDSGGGGGGVFVPLIEGKIFYDEEGDCIPTGGELPLQGWKVQVSGSSFVHAVFTDGEGKFKTYVSPGDYAVSLVEPGSLWQSCGIMNVSIGSGIPNPPLELGAKSLAKCPQMSIEAEANQVRPCSTSTYMLNWCNTGTDIAENAEIQVSLHPLQTLTEATLPHELLPGNIVRLLPGSAEAGQCGSVALTVLNSCDAQMGQVICNDVSIFPDAICLPSGEGYTGASIRVEGTCNGSQVSFQIKNIGAGDMAQPAEYRVIKDDVQIQDGTFSLAANGVQGYTFPADGATYRLEAAQAAGYPYASNPSKVIEACAPAGAAFSTGFVEQFSAADYGPAFAQACNLVTNSYDPNDKQGFPLGFGEQHLVQPNTDIEYTIRFQNMGNDTAFHLKILDTLSQLLQVGSLVPGPSSHPYRLSILNNSVLEFDFEGIQLPALGTNEPASQGFVSYRIAQQPDLPDGSDIRNSAGIYFDQNPAVLTNTTSHVVGRDFVEIISGVGEGGISLGLSVSPNPASDWLQVKWQGKLLVEKAVLQVSGTDGRLLKLVVADAAGGSLQLEVEDLPIGLYFLTLSGEGLEPWTGRFVKR